MVKQSLNEKFYQLLSITIITAVLLAGAGSAVFAQQVDPAQLQQALARAQGLLRQLAQQKGALEAEKATTLANLAGVEQKLTRSQAKLKSLEADFESQQRDAERISGTLAQTKRRLERVETRLNEVVEKYKVLDASNRETLQETAALKENLARTQDTLRDAELKNEEMFQVNEELLEKFLKKGSWDSMLQLEPFTGIKQVEMESQQQEYQFRIEDARIMR